MELIYFVLSCHGLTQILIHGSIFKSIRPNKNILNGFFHCPMCVGFWVGVFLFGINEFTELFTFKYSLTNLFILGCVGSGTSYVLDVVFDDCGIRIDGGENDGTLDDSRSSTL